MAGSRATLGLALALCIALAAAADAADSKQVQGQVLQYSRRQLQMTPPPDAPGQQQQHPQKPSGAAKAKERAAQVGKEVKTAVPQVVQAARTVEVVVYRTIACNKCVLACQGRGGQPMGFKVCTNPLQVLQVCKCAIGMKAKQAAAGVAAAAVAAAKSAVPKP